jgi:hypothetical protein
MKTTQETNQKGLDNLIPANKRSLEEARELGREGGIKSGQVRKKKKEAKKIIEAIMESKAPESLIKKFKELYPDYDSKTIEDICNMAMIRRIMAGNVRAYEAVYDRKDGKPTQETDITSGGKPITDININVIDYTDGNKSKQ